MNTNTNTNTNINAYYVVGGYYDPSIYLSWDENEWGEPVLKDIGDFKPFESVKMYNVEKDLAEILSLGFLSSFPEWFEEENDVDVRDSDIATVAKELHRYTETDDLAYLALFNAEDKAKAYLVRCLEEIKEAEENYEVYDQVQNEHGFYVYRMKPKEEIED